MPQNQLSLNERLKFLRARKSLEQKDFADLLKIRQPSYSSIERGKVTPSIKQLELIAEFTGCNFLWLATGEGDMFPVANPVAASLQQAGKPTSNDVAAVATGNEESIQEKILRELQELRKALVMMAETNKSLSQLLSKFKGNRSSWQLSERLAA